MLQVHLTHKIKEYQESVDTLFLLLLLFPDQERGGCGVFN